MQCLIHMRALLQVLGRVGTRLLRVPRRLACESCLAPAAAAAPPPPSTKEAPAGSEEAAPEEEEAEAVRQLVDRGRVRLGRQLELGVEHEFERVEQHQQREESEALESARDWAQENSSRRRSSQQRLTSGATRGR